MEERFPLFASCRKTRFPHLVFPRIAVPRIIILGMEEDSDLPKIAISDMRVLPKIKI